MMNENMKEFDMDEVNNLIENCEWLQYVAGIPICKGEVAPCNNVIHSGKCTTLKEYFKEKENELEEKSKKALDVILENGKG